MGWFKMMRRVGIRVGIRVGFGVRVNFTAIACLLAEAIASISEDGENPMAVGGEERHGTVAAGTAPASFLPPLRATSTTRAGAACCTVEQATMLMRMGVPFAMARLFP